MSEVREREIEAVPSVSIHRLTVAQYDAMAAAGILGPEDRVELLDGWLVTKVTKRPRHRVATAVTRDALQAVVPSGWYADTQERRVEVYSDPAGEGPAARYSRRVDHAPGQTLVVSLRGATVGTVAVDELVA